MGPQFTDIKPGRQEGQPSYEELILSPNFAGLDAVASRQFLAQTFDRFRIHQTIFLEFRIITPNTGITAILLQPWWLRPQQENRAIGPSITDFITGANAPSVDEVAFGTPDISLASTERLWQTDQQQEQQRPPTFPAVPATKVYSNMVDTVWRFPINTALVGADYSITKAFSWPAHGYALGFTSAFEGADGGEGLPTVGISFMTGATHSISQENID